MLLALIASAAAAPLSDCATTYGEAALLAEVSAADQQIEEMDASGLLAARAALLVELPCARERLGAPLIGAIHRVVATAASVAHEDLAVAPALASMLVADPGYQLPEEAYSPSDPVRLSLTHAGLLVRQGQARPLAAPPDGHLEVDGLPASASSTSRPSVVQAFAADGRLVETRYLWPEDPLGSWAPTEAPPPSRVVARTRHPTPLLVASGASLVVSGVLYGLASADRHSFRDHEVPRTNEELIALRQQTNGLTIGWMVTGAAALGLGATAVIRW